MIKWKIVLDTVTDVNDFVSIVSQYKEDLFVENNEKTFRVNAKSLMGMLYSTEWRDDTFITCETEPTGLYQNLKKYID